jgi:hypothetical protein
MDSGDFPNFIDAINLGFEPRAVDGYRPLYGFIFLREGDENKSVQGRPSLPIHSPSDVSSGPISGL